MKTILTLLLLLPLLAPAQDVRKIIEPVTRTPYWISKPVKLGGIRTYLCASPNRVFLYLETEQVPSSLNQVVLVTSTDTIVAPITGVQGHYDLNTPYYFEYRLSKEDLQKLTRSPVIKVSITHGFYFSNLPMAPIEVFDIQSKRQQVLMAPAAEILKAMEGQ